MYLNIEIPVGISHTYIIPWYDITDISYRGIYRQDPISYQIWDHVNLNNLYHIRV